MAKRCQKCQVNFHGSAVFCMFCGRKLPLEGPGDVPSGKMLVPLKLATVDADTIHRFTQAVLGRDDEELLVYPTVNQLRKFLGEFLTYEPRQILIRWYGLDGKEPRDFRAIAREAKKYPTAIRSTHDKALVHLRQPLHELLGYVPFDADP